MRRDRAVAVPDRHHRLGIAALCTPFTAPAAETLFSIGSKVFGAQRTFSERSADALDTLQKALPFLAAASAWSVAAANSDAERGSNYVAIAVLSPLEGASIEPGAIMGTDELMAAVDASKGELADAAAHAEQAAAAVNAAKLEAFAHDCGNNPGYCMYERAATLAGMSGQDNPLYRSVDTWSFAVALQRAQAYYPIRLAQERPADSSIEEQARSVLRTHFYEYAVDALAQGYVHDDGDTFDALFPRLPRSTAEMRRTELYTQRVYPATESSGQSVAHAWSGCPEAAGSSRLVSVSDIEAGGYGTCPTCKFTAESLGSVAEASTSIENGFEHHYNIVAEQAELYEQARAQLEPLAAEVKGTAQPLIEQCVNVGRNALSLRIDARPPGTYGAIALVANTGGAPADLGFETSFVSTDATLGIRAAVSGATLIEDPAGEGGTIISSLLDGVKAEGDATTGLAGVMLDVWSSLLFVYSEGQHALDGVLATAAGSLSLDSESGLGRWASSLFSDSMATIGLQPAELDALKPVIVNTAHIARADGQSTALARYLTVKEAALSLPGSTTDPFSSLVTDIERSALDDLAGSDGAIELATIAPLGEDGPSIPITITLPPSIAELPQSAISAAADTLRSIAATVTGTKAWV